MADLKASDDAETATWVRDHPGQAPPEEVQERRTKRLRRAFNRIAPEKRYEGVRREPGELVPYFKGGNRETPLGNLSTGEKQIVYRGAFLLRYEEALSKIVALIDEPELSLHPAWQARIVDFFDTIVGEEQPEANQIIIATHSPFVVHGSPTAKHVILKRDPVADGVIVSPEPTFPVVGSWETAVAAFALSDLLGPPGCSFLVVTEGKTDAALLRIAWTKLKGGTPMPFNMLAAGGTKKAQSFLGHDPGTLGPLGEALSDRGIERILGLFDFDGEGYAAWNGTVKETVNSPTNRAAGECTWRKRHDALLWAALLPVPSFRETYASLERHHHAALEIELLFADEFISPFTEQQQIVMAAPGTTSTIVPDGRKAALALAAENFPSAAFATFEPIFSLIENVRTHS